MFGFFLKNAPKENKPPTTPINDDWTIIDTSAEKVWDVEYHIVRNEKGQRELVKIFSQD